MRRTWIPVLLCASVLAISGCGAADGTVHGTVTANGTNIEEGYINFNPTDDKNGTFGAPIVNGKYSAKIAPGKYQIVITGGAKATAYPKSQEELKNLSDKDLERKDQVPENATGNRQDVEIKKGDQELHFMLEFPSK